MNTNQQQSAGATSGTEGQQADPNASQQQQQAAGAEGAEGQQAAEGQQGTEGQQAGAEGQEGQQAAEGQEGGDPAEFWNEVDQLWGREEPIPVEYGDVDPVSPQGAFLREQALWNAAQQTMEAELAAKYPRGMRYLLHLQNGGSDEEFFRTRSTTTPDADVLKADVNLQKQLVRQDLLDRKVPTAYVDDIISKMATDNKLEAESLRIREERATSEATLLEQERLRIQQENQQLEQRVEQFTTNLGTVINSDLKFLIPETKKGEFAKFFTENLRTNDEGNFVVALPVGQDNLKLLAQALWLIQSKGDLTKAVQQSAGSQQALRLRTAVQNNQQAAAAAAGAGQSSAGGRLVDKW